MVDIHNINILHIEQKSKKFLLGNIRISKNHVFLCLFIFQKPFTIVEFEDGVALIHSSWLKEGNMCSYPPFKEQSKINKTVAEMCPPSENWSLYKVKRIFCSAGKIL